MNLEQYTQAYHKCQAIIENSGATFSHYHLHSSEAVFKEDYRQFINWVYLVLEGKKDKFILDEIDLESGLCGRVLWYVPRIITRAGFASWSKFSGNLGYPVPCEGLTPSKAYSELPLYEGQYGEDRIELYYHCIKYIKQLFEEFGQ